MAYTYIQAQMILPFKTGLPGDEAITTWSWRRDDSVNLEDAYGYIVTRMADRFMKDTHGANPAINTFLSQYIDRLNCKVRLAPIDLTSGHETGPAEIATWSFPAVTNTVHLPLEVACCSSIYAAFGAPSDQARRRGRIYFGPLNGSALGGTVGTQPPRPSSTMTAAIAAAAKAVADLNDDLVDWCVWSRADHAMRPVVGGWVDDEFDTVRRRGIGSSTRTGWVAA